MSWIDNLMAQRRDAEKSLSDDHHDILYEEFMSRFSGFYNSETDRFSGIAEPGGHPLFREFVSFLAFGCLKNGSPTKSTIKRKLFCAKHLGNLIADELHASRVPSVYKSGARQAKRAIDDLVPDDMEKLFEKMKGSEGQYLDQIKDQGQQCLSFLKLTGGHNHKSNRSAKSYSAIRMGLDGEVFQSFIRSIAMLSITDISSTTREDLKDVLNSFTELQDVTPGTLLKENELIIYLNGHPDTNNAFRMLNDVHYQVGNNTFTCKSMNELKKAWSDHQYPGDVAKVLLSFTRTLKGNLSDIQSMYNTLTLDGVTPESVSSFQERLNNPYTLGLMSLDMNMGDYGIDMDGKTDIAHKINQILKTAGTGMSIHIPDFDRPQKPDRGSPSPGF